METDNILIAYKQMVKDQIEALNTATGLSWEEEATGGNCCALVARCNDGVNPSPYLMLTNEALIVDIGEDSCAVLGLYADYDESNEADRLAFLGDAYGQILTLADVVAFVVDTVQGWGVK
jgi:hypothetical protein